MCKTYILPEDYLIMRKWWIDNYDKMVLELGEAIYLWPFYVFENKLVKKYYPKVTPELLLSRDDDIQYYKNLTRDFVLWYTTEEQDKWLIKNCHLEPWIENVAFEYRKDWIGFKGSKVIADYFRKEFANDKNNKPKCRK